MITNDMLSGLVSHFNGTVEIEQRATVVESTPPIRKSRRHHGRPAAEASEKVADAKHRLMERYGVAEPIAHRLVQRLSMECRTPFEEAADIIRLGLMALDHLRSMDDGDGQE